MIHGLKHLYLHYRYILHNVVLLEFLKLFFYLPKTALPIFLTPKKVFTYFSEVAGRQSGAIFFISPRNWEGLYEITIEKLFFHSQHSGSCRIQDFFGESISCFCMGRFRSFVVKILSLHTVSNTALLFHNKNIF